MSARSLRAFCLALAVFAAASASAQTDPVTFDLERLELNPSGTGSLVVGSAELLPANTFRSAIIAHYAHQPLLLISNEHIQGRIINERLTLHLMRQFSVAQRVELALTLPIVVFQSGDDLTAVGMHRLAPGGLASPIFSARVAFLRSADGAPFDLAGQVATALPFGNAFGFAKNPGFTLAPRLTASYKLPRDLMVTAEAGGSLRPPVRLGDLTIHNELNANLGLSTLGHGFRGEVALRGGYYFEKAPSSLEVLLGGRYGLTDRIELTTMVSYGALRAPGTPLFRVLFGASFLEGAKLSDVDQPRPAPAPAPLPLTDPTQPLGKAGETKPDPCGDPNSHVPAECPELDLDGDGVKNAVDACPAAAEDKDGFQDEDGCPDPDNDADGIEDAKDKCPNEAGPAEREGCPIPDEDKDGVEDSVDQCPKNPGPPERKGCPLQDSDGDGILDPVDGCPNEAGPVEARGCPVKDTDEDSVPDHLDNCPKEKGTPQNRGCPPAQKQFVYITKEKLVITDTVHFATNSARVLPKSFNLLKQVANVIKDHPEIKKIRVEGHTDNKGNRLTNLRLSQQRADSVRRYLILQGVDSERLESRGFGPTRPIMPNLTPRGRAANRRVEFVIPDDAE